MHRKQGHGSKDGDLVIGGKTWFCYNFLAKLHMLEQLGCQQPEHQANRQMQEHIDNALHRIVLAEQRLHPDETAIGKHSHFQLRQAPIIAENRTVTECGVVKYQAILQAHAVNNTDGQQAGDDSQRPEQYCLLHHLYG
ncbi:hypothetical protein [Comamonas sp. J-3]|uniref:hypothetical protein n=1 Tax=Comamonas trifloxystrobinivorans TaxID=3350256 RepID=UPI00372D5456